MRILNYLKTLLPENQYSLKRPTPDLTSTYRLGIVLVGLLILLTLLRLWKINTLDLWGGDTFALDGINLGWREGFRYFVEDIVHPPLFYLFLAGWMQLGGQSALWLKSFPLIIAISTTIPFLLLTRELKLSSASTLLALFLYSINSFLIHYAHEVRSYTLFHALAVWSLWAFVRYVNNPHPTRKDGWLLICLNLMMVYTHYYGWLVVGTQVFSGIFLNRQRAASYLRQTVFLVIAYVPWTLLLIQPLLNRGGLGPNLDWIPKPTLKTLARLFFTFNGYASDNDYINLLGILLFATPILIWLYSLRKQPAWFDHADNRIIAWLALVSLGPVALIFVISWIFPQALFTDRYFIFITVPYLLLLSNTIVRVKPRLLRHFLLVAVIFWSLTASVRDLQSDRIAWTSPQVGSRLPWSEIADDILEFDSFAEPIDTIYVVPSYSGNFLTGYWSIAVSLDYHFRLLNKDEFVFPYLQNIDRFNPNPEDELVWLSYFHLDPNIPEQLMYDKLTDRGFIIENELIYENERQQSLKLLLVRQLPQ